MAEPAKVLHLFPQHKLRFVMLATVKQEDTGFLNSKRNFVIEVSNLVDPAGTFSYQTESLRAVGVLLVQLRAAAAHYAGRLRVHNCTTHAETLLGVEPGECITVSKE